MAKTRLVMTAAGALMLAGCSFQGAIDGLVPPERQAEIIRTAQTLCREPASLRSEFAPELWEQSSPLFGRLPAECPTDANVIWRFASYNFNTSSTMGAATDRREFALVVAGDDDGPWTEIQLNYQQIGDAPRQIIGWNAARTSTRPASLAFIDNYDNIRWYGLGGTALALALLIAALIWVSRRRKAAGKGWTDA